MRRFVILKHDHPYLHWDLLVEGEHSASTWRLLREPCVEEPIFAEGLPDHRLMYLDYEGPVSGERGTVERVVCGYITAIESAGNVTLLDLAGQSFANRATVSVLADGRCFIQFREGSN